MLKSLFCLLACPLPVGLACGLRNHDLVVSKPSKSPEDRTRPRPRQPLTWLDFFWVSPLDYREFRTLAALQNETLEIQSH
jgi:hypothetical protein